MFPTKGLIWMGGLRGLTRLLTFIRLTILARILTPYEFGLFGIATIVLSFFENLTESGINIFFIQKEGKLNDYLNQAYIISIGRGMIIFALILLGADPITRFFDISHASSFINLIAFVALFRGFINPAIVKFQKDLQFNKEFYLRSVTVIADTLVSIAVCIYLGSAIGLIYGMIASVIVEILISFVFIQPKPKLIYDKLKFLQIINRGKWITAAGMFQYLFQNLDNIVIGKIMGSAFLGLYQNAYRISTIPITEVSDVINRVALPLYAKFSDQKTYLTYYFWRFLAILLLFIVPFGLVIQFFTKEVVLLLLGQQWLEIVGVVKLLSYYGILKAVIGSAQPIFLALKQQELVTYLTLVSLIGLTVLIVPMVMNMGLIGAGISVVISTVLTLPLLGFYIKRLFRYNFSK